MDEINLYYGAWCTAKMTRLDPTKTVPASVEIPVDSRLGGPGLSHATLQKTYLDLKFSESSARLQRGSRIAFSTTSGGSLSFLPFLSPETSSPLSSTSFSVGRLCSPSMLDTSGSESLTLLNSLALVIMHFCIFSNGPTQSDPCQQFDKRTCKHLSACFHDSNVGKRSWAWTLDQA